MTTGVQSSRTEPGTKFEPNSYAQWRVLASPAKEVLHSSAYGKGKTRGICEAADFDCRMFPGNLVTLSRKTLASMWTTTLKVLLDEVIDQEHRSWGWKPHADGGATLYYPNGSQLICVGLDDPGRARSAAVGSWYIDQGEELAEEEFETAAGRLRLGSIPAGRRRIVAAVNPENKSHWLFRRFRPDKAPKGGSYYQHTQHDVTLPNSVVIPKGRLFRECVVSSDTDNLENLPEDYLFRLSQLKGVYRLRYYEGLWVAFEGAIYPHFDARVCGTHVVKRPVEWLQWGGYPPPHWLRYRACDFGFDPSPFVWQWWAREPGAKRFWCYREIYRTRTLVEDHAERILAEEDKELKRLRECALEIAASAEEAREWGKYLRSMEFEYTFADHDKEDRMTLARRDIDTQPANKDVSTGIQTVYQMLSLDEDGEPGIRFCEDALVELDEKLAAEERPTRSWEEFEGYMWQKQIEGRSPREEPVKIDDHACDATRYLFNTLKMIGEL